MPDVTVCKCIQLNKIFECHETEDVVVCKTCLNAEVQGDGAPCVESRLPYLKRCITHKCHLDAVTKSRIVSMDLLNFLRETPENRNNRHKYASGDRAIMLNMFILSVQEIHTYQYVENFVRNWFKTNSLENLMRIKLCMSTENINIDNFYKLWRTDERDAESKLEYL